MKVLRFAVFVTYDPRKYSATPEVLRLDCAQPAQSESTHTSRSREVTIAGRVTLGHS